jgi:two-component system cell cycle sensor histidine kinase/response regulator CckA
MNPSEWFALDGAGWPALLVDEAGTVFRANDAAIKVFGQVIAASGSPLSAIWAETAQSPSDWLANWVKTPAPTVVLKFKWKAGGVATHTVSVCITQRDGQRAFLLQLLGETTNADAVAAHKHKLDCAMQLARTVSLDFNNALTSILGHTSLILGRIESDNPWHRSLQEIEKSAARAAEISNDLGSFSRSEKENSAQAAGNINDLVKRCLETFQRKVPADRVKWASHIERHLFVVRFDEAKLLQALVRIVENAVESLSDPGRITLQTRNVELKESTRDCAVQLVPGNYVCIEIADTGRGIELDVLPRVFEPFFTTKRGHRGLGLAWVYGIITNHGGGVAISSKPGTGTSVRVYLPAESRRTRDVHVEAGDLHGKQTILMVDDEDLVLTMAEAILSAYGYTVVTANSGQKALEIFSKNKVPIDLLVTDLVMPMMSGRELVDQVRKVAPHVPIICTSGYSWPNAREDDTSYLQKPFTSRELLLRVKAALA